MRYVILRDDDTNALTPIACLERLYRPFLDRGLPVNLAVIPSVRTDVTFPNGKPEGYLAAGTRGTSLNMPICENQKLIDYLKANQEFHTVQHGCYHDVNEFDRQDVSEIKSRLAKGAELFAEAGFRKATTFVAPYDKLSRVALEETARVFDVISTGWFEMRRLPYTWLPQYALKKLRQNYHWRVGRTALLAHPGCLLSYQRPCETMLESIQNAVASRRVTVLVTHWWEYFRDGQPNESFIQTLHETAEYLAASPDIQVISFDDLTEERVPLN